MTRQEKIDFLNKKSHNKFNKKFEQLSDEKLDDFYRISNWLTEDMEKKESLSLSLINDFIEKALDNNDIDSYTVDDIIKMYNAFYNFSPIISESEYRQMKKLVEKSCPSDSIFLTRETDLKIQSLWKEYNTNFIDEDGSYHIPSDLILSDTIPLPDVIIEIDERNSDISDGSNLYSRFVIFDKKDRISGILYDIVGAIILKTPIPGQGEIYIINPIIIFKADDNMLSTKVGLSNNNLLNNKFKIASKNKDGLATEIQALGLFLSTWYGVQLAMLHPIIKEVFSNGKRFKQRAINQLIKTSGEQAKNKCKYIKYHRIEDPNFEEKSYNKMGYTFERKTMIWWVCGHYRNRQGKKEFVKGYWKGPLRELKTLTEAREREIAQLEEG